MEITKLTRIIIPLREVSAFLLNRLPENVKRRDLKPVLFDLAHVVLGSDNLLEYYDCGIFYESLATCGIEEDEIGDLMDEVGGTLYDQVAPYLQEIDLFDNSELAYMLDIIGIDDLMITIEPTNLELRS